MRKTIRHIEVVGIYDRGEFDADPNKNLDLTDLVLDSIKGEYRALAEVCTLLSVILVKGIAPMLEI